MKPTLPTLPHLYTFCVLQAEEVEVQTTRVQLLEAAVATGRVQPAELEQESSALQGLRVRARHSPVTSSSLPARALHAAGESGRSRP